MIPVSFDPADSVRPAASKKASADTKELMERFVEAQEAVESLHDRWRTCHAFEDGNQYVVYRNGQPRETKAPSWRVRLTINLIQPVVKTAVGKLLQAKPGWEVAPSGSGYGRARSARDTEHALEHIYYQSSWKRVRRETVKWSQVTGTGFTYVYWDPMRRDVAFRAIDPWDIYPEPNATHTSEARWVFIRHRMTREEIETLWPDAQLPPANERQTDEYRSGILGNYADTSKSLLTVLEYEEAPTIDRPNGRRVKFCGDTVLEDGDLPLAPHYSVECLRAGAKEGRFWGSGTVWDMLDAQREYNRTRSQAVEHRNLHTSPAWIYPAGAVGKDVPLNRPDTRVEVKGNIPVDSIRRLDPQPIPPSLESFAASIKSDLQDAAGTHEVSQGRGPSGVVAARALGILATQDEVKAFDDVEEVEDYITGVGLRALVAIQKNADEYSFRLNGDAGLSMQRTLSSADLSLMVQVRPGSMRYKVREAEQQRALEMYQVGALGQPGTPDALKAFRRLADVDSGDRDLGLAEDVEDAIQENEEALAGGEIHVNWLENHEVHIDWHRRAFLDNTYPLESRLSLEQHIAEHFRQLHMQSQGLPVYVQAFGQDPATGAQAQPQGQPAGAPEGPEQTNEYQTVLTGGGQPELNGAIQPTEMDPQGMGGLNA